jgi:hypothetical protein
MKEDPAASLDRLVDIVEPTAAPLWPLAPGWWVLLVVALVTLFSVAFVCIRRWRRAAYRREASQLLDAMGDDLSQLPKLLKRVALSAFPRQSVAALNGQNWIDFLNTHCDGAQFDRGLLDLAYRPDELEPASLEALRSGARHWIRTHRIEDPC